MNSITTDFSHWLERYCAQKTCPSKKIANSLITQVQEVTSIKALHKLLETIDLQPTPIQLPAFFGKDPFVNKVQDLKQTVQMVASVDLDAIRLMLDNLHTHDMVKDLITLLKEILVDPRYLLHINANSLLHKLENPDRLKSIVNHLVNQTTIPRPTQPHPGSFDAITPLTPQHKTCQDLLRNNAGTFDEQNIDSQEANHLLQQVLKIYQDVNSPAPKVPIESASQSIFSNCCIL